jgi:hypothetical protein
MVAYALSKEGCHDLGRQMAGKSKVCYEAMVAGLVATIAALFDGSGPQKPKPGFEESRPEYDSVRQAGQPTSSL